MDPQVKHYRVKGPPYLFAFFLSDKRKKFQIKWNRECFFSLYPALWRNHFAFESAQLNLIRLANYLIDLNRNCIGDYGVRCDYQMFLSTRFKVYSWISMDLFWKMASAVQCTMTTNHEKLNSWRPLNHRFLCKYFELLIPIMKFSSGHNKQKVAKPKFCTKLIINDLYRCNFKRRGLKSGPGILPNSFFIIIREKYNFCQLSYHGLLTTLRIFVLSMKYWF